MSDYPEHDKQHAIIEEAGTIQSFIDGIARHGYQVCKLHDTGRTRMNDEAVMEWSPVIDPNVPMAAHFGIDLDKIADEKEAMFQTLVESNR